jgi:hypothetical protein
VNDSDAASKRAFTWMANEIGFARIDIVMAIFVEKLILNMMKNSKSEEDNNLIGQCLEVLSSYLQNSIT